MKNSRIIFSFSFLSVLAFIGIFWGATTSKAVIAIAQDKYAELQTFSKVLNLVQQYYVEEVNVKKLIQGAIKGMLEELDPHTNYMNPELFKEFENETSGEFAGLGIEISIQDEVLTIISPIEDTPAYIAGIQAGDKVVSIDGKSTKGLSLIECAHLIKGKNGSIIKLMVYRKGFEKPKEFSIKRGVVKVHSVKPVDLNDGYLYVRVTSFIENTGKELKATIDKETKKNKEIKGMIIDLRNNPGGLLSQAISISDMFLNDGIIVSTIGRNRKEKEVTYAKKEGTYPEFPIVVLINEYSASASEILSGALQDHKRALIMGQRSFGKGSVQSVVKLGDGSGLKLTVARYYTPSGVSIQGTGIKPDVLVDNVNPDAFEKAIIKSTPRREADIQGHLIGEQEKVDKDGVKVKPYDSSDMFWIKSDEATKVGKFGTKEELLKKDFQVMQAYNYLKALKVFKK